jgi:phosphatidylinositol alpha-mannosyltransferase
VRVALACPYAWDAPGGVQVHVRQLARQLQARGHDVLVLAPGWRDPGEQGVAIVGRPLRMRYQGTVAPISFGPGTLARVGRELRGFHPDVVHAHEPLTPSVGMFAAMRSRAPVVATFHAYADRSRLFSAAAPILRIVWRRLQVRLAVSEAAARFVRSRMGGMVRIVPNGLDVERFAPGVSAAAPGLPAGRRLLWVGRLDPQKGFPVAIRAFAELAPEFPDLSLIVVGDGSDRTAVSELPAEVGRRVVMVGSVPNDELPPYQAGADAFVAPALGQESFGYVLVEAMAAGVPVIASDIPGYREVVRDGIEGLLVPPGDPVALAKGVRRVLGDPTLAYQFHEYGMARARRYTWDVVVEELESAYKDAIAVRSG